MSCCRWRHQGPFSGPGPGAGSKGWVEHFVGTCDRHVPTLIVLLQVKESMAEGEPGHTSKARSVSTGARWFQSKRVPLYFMVGAGKAPLGVSGGCVVMHTS